MDVYLYTTPDTPVGAVSETFVNIHALREMKFLTDSSVVWANADAPEVGLWVLAQHSTYVSVFRTVHAGTIRATRSSLRWGRSTRATLEDSALPILDVRHLPIDVPTATAVIMHRDRTSKLQVVGDSNMQHADARGVFTFDPFYIIDAPNWKPYHDAPPPSPYEAAHAMMHGTGILTVTCSEAGAEFVRTNIEAFKTTFDPNAATFLSKGLSAIDNYAAIQQEIIAKNVEKIGKSKAWSVATAPSAH